MNDKLRETMAMVADDFRRDMEVRALSACLGADAIASNTLTTAPVELAGVMDLTEDADKALALMALQWLFDADVRIEDMKDVDDDGAPVYGWLLDPNAVQTLGAEPARPILVVPSVRRALEIVEAAQRRWAKDAADTKKPPALGAEG